MQQREQAKKNGPPVTVRFRSKKELEKIRRAARFEGLSLNTFVVGRASIAADEVIRTATTTPKPADVVAIAE